MITNFKLWNVCICMGENTFLLVNMTLPVFERLCLQCIFASNYLERFCNTIVEFLFRLTKKWRRYQGGEWGHTDRYNTGTSQRGGGRGHWWCGHPSKHDPRWIRFPAWVCHSSRLCVIQKSISWVLLHQYPCWKVRETCSGFTVNSLFIL